MCLLQQSGKDILTRGFDVIATGSENGKVKGRMRLARGRVHSTQILTASPPTMLTSPCSTQLRADRIPCTLSPGARTIGTKNTCYFGAIRVYRMRRSAGENPRSVCRRLHDPTIPFHTFRTYECFFRRPMIGLGVSGVLTCRDYMLTYTRECSGPLVPFLYI
jgi:hypothetical protein